MKFLPTIPSRFIHPLKLGLRSLAAHRLRTLLTALGIVLGVASVIVMLAVGEAARYQALKQLEDLGATTILLRSVKPTDEPTQRQGVDLLAYGLTFRDLERIRATVPTVTAATPMREYRKTVRNLDKKMEVRVIGVTPDFLRQHNIRLTAGRGIEGGDDESFAPVAVLGSAAAETLFPTQDPIGRAVTLESPDRSRAFTVIGIAAPKTLAAAGADSGDADFNKVMFIPFQTDRVRLGVELMTMKAGSFSVEKLEISQVTVRVGDVADVPRTAKALQSLLDQFHPRKDVTLSVPLDLLRKAEETQRLFTLILGSIAGISLLVGGIGIVNIMLATVTERTREIGIRRALGARQRDIASQFLAEAVLLSGCGGIVGVALGIGLAFVVSGVIGLPTIIRLWSPLLAVGVALVVGLISGVLPARRAARLDPVEALRHV
ncbi:abc transporter atp-binding protein : ABC-type antimicrobial peptide transport system, permease component OS=Singulisphaera acidiphila (strain ATCC BAA-1392 / DSM 18658 / VKM B-2454 / MOB10) GN=Sinac_5745 PE=4 SV=1: MacB_PCD: FtsX [Gemmata massiliana]|uniref:ABC3 transporter permease protein domain-containing protein n=1 Tax=Gemmata massiliana TaxID=1210884 RepID=A0A6P2CZB1_9BACT|nr:ABC transporter permease [Gemmata massiliana]VTR93134.1 abc transporter atp-binding protein : ABC-type antimicrobial peptide transport system, permease component OS=Singulisphaera acidiphila (strain ATCC BAA-1392 / DSM 18658 / VKM B-2454 / MOB10) GN=Sinac_5745 PE=4 SV=1: MacB_PCD: FtsX [Gemmata massiliana]